MRAALLGRRAGAAPRILVLRTPGDHVSVRFTLRAVAVSAALVVLALGVAVVTIGTGDTVIAPDEVVRVLLGGGDAGDQFLVRTVRLPRALVALCAGAAFGAAGAIFQSLTRNPLGSPDVVGLNTGAATGALLAVLLLGGGAAARTVGGVAGSLAAGTVIYLLANRQGVLGGRLILTGIGVGATLAAVNSYLLVRANIFDALEVSVWLTGSLNGRGWTHAWPVALALVALLPVAVLLSRRMRVLELGDEFATAAGVEVERTRISLLLVGAALTAVATSVAGPIEFVALAAPQLARRLTRSGGVSVASSACMGALLLATSDLAALRLFAPTQLPVGAVTLVVGGAYLAWLLARRRAAA